jgi:glycosyltransferase involved in cell wall biosynthesis
MEDAFRREPELSVIMPCLNEAGTLGACLAKARGFINAHGIAAEIIVADNGSSDGSASIAEAHGARVVKVPVRGYGAALVGGVAAAGGEYIVIGDADDSYDFGALYPFLEKLRQGCDLVMGCRLPAGGGTIMPGAMPWKHRWLGNPALSSLGRFFFRAPVTDFHCGLRAFSREAFERMNLRTTGMEFASEMVIKAALLKMRVGQVPVTLYRDGRSRPPHLRSWRDGWRHLRLMLMCSPRWVFLAPGVALLLGGAFFFTLLAHGPLTAGRVVFDTNSLLMASL